MTRKWHYIYVVMKGNKFLRITKNERIGYINSLKKAAFFASCLDANTFCEENNLNKFTIMSLAVPTDVTKGNTYNIHVRLSC